MKRPVVARSKVNVKGENWPMESNRIDETLKQNADR